MLRRFFIRALVAIPIAAIIGALTLVPPRTTDAVFHFSGIDEVMTSYDGDPTVQFVEIRMFLAGQNVVANTILGAFDDSGTYLGDVLVVPMNVPNSGTDVRWIMGTSQFATVSGITPDFIMPADLPTGGGMVCWGGPFDHTNPAQYTDCVAYGTYSGPTNLHIGTPTSLNAVGHSLQRTQDTNSSEADFQCGDPADPTNNAGASASLAATISCTPSVGGIAALPDVSAAPLEADGVGGPSARLIALAVAGAAVLGGGAWFARRRRLQ